MESSPLILERLKSLDIQPLTYLLDGGRDKSKFKRIVRQLFERDHLLIKDKPFNMSHEEDLEITMLQIKRFMEVLRELKDPRLQEAFKTQMIQYDCTLSMRLYVHFTLFKETIWAQGTAEQYEMWRDDIDNMNIIGCFAMTELGHSSYLKGIETIATWDPETRDFVIHSQSLTATKWWIGMAGQTATHTVALCNLKIGKNYHGLHWFIVPLRSPETGQLYPGISAGHLGPKYGRNGLDNGWIQFSQVRVPLENMLMRWSQVDQLGKFTRSIHSEIAYATLIGERYAALNEIFYLVSKGIVASVRYAVVRKQGPNKESIMDFQNHQFQLTPVLAGSYIVRLVFLTLSSQWEKILDANNKSVSKSFGMLLKDNHSTSAGLKAWLGWWGADALERIRRSLGGHAYSMYSNIPSLIGDYGVLTTGGGDNYVLAQQCSRYLLKSLSDAKASNSLGSSCKYMCRYKTLLAFEYESHGEDLSLQSLLKIFESLSVHMLTETQSNIQKDLQKTQDFNRIVKDRMVELIECSRPHSMYTALNVFHDIITRQPDNWARSSLVNLGTLFGLTQLEALLSRAFQYKILKPTQSKEIREQILQLCKMLRPHIVSLTDAFDYPDWVLKTPLGRYDGNIYENYFNTVLSGGSIGVAPYWDNVVVPTLQSKL